MIFDSVVLCPFLDLTSEASSANTLDDLRCILVNVVCEVGCIILLSSHFWRYTPPKTNTAKENLPFEDVFPIEHGDFPLPF